MVVHFIVVYTHIVIYTHIYSFIPAISHLIFIMIKHIFYKTSHCISFCLILTGGIRGVNMTEKIRRTP